MVVGAEPAVPVWLVAGGVDAVGGELGTLPGVAVAGGYGALAPVAAVPGCVSGPVSVAVFTPLFDEVLVPVELFTGEVGEVAGIVPVVPAAVPVAVPVTPLVPVTPVVPVTPLVPVTPPPAIGTHGADNCGVDVGTVPDVPTVPGCADPALEPGLVTVPG